MTTPRLDGSPSVGTIAAALRDQNKITYADLQQTRVGLLQDIGADRIIWVSLPWWAPNGTGVNIGEYTKAGATPSQRRLQMLPVEGLLQWIPPRIQSRMTTLSLANDPAAGAEITASQIWTAAQLRQRVIIGNAALKVAWHEDYAIHGGPYGLFEASLNRDLALTFVEWQLLKPSLSFPINGRIIMAFNACVSEFARTGDVDGFTADCIISPESEIYRPRARTSTSPGTPQTAGEVGLLTSLARQATRGSDFPAPLYGDE